MMMMMDEAKARLASAEEGEILLVDVRSLGEWNAGHLPGAIHIPFDQLEEYMDVFEAFKGKEIYVYCHVGGRAQVAVQYLHSKGEYRAVNIGGVVSWKGEFVYS